MFDAVVNHISAHSEWGQSFLEDDPRYRYYFTVADPEADLSQDFRPLALPWLTEVETAVGPKQVLTTYSTNQIDLNCVDPNVLLDVIDTLLFYLARGAELIRWSIHGVVLTDRFFRGTPDPIAGGSCAGSRFDNRYQGEQHAYWLTAVSSVLVA